MEEIPEAAGTFLERFGELGMQRYLVRFGLCVHGGGVFLKIGR